MRSHCSLYIFVSAMPEPTFLKLVCIKAPDPRAKANFINLNHQSVCLCWYPPIVTRQRICKTLPRQRILVLKYKNSSTRLSVCSPCRLEESRRLVLPRSSFFIFLLVSPFLFHLILHSPFLFIYLHSLLCIVLYTLSSFVFSLWYLSHISDSFELSLLFSAVLTSLKPLLP
jgi:hypothetical protein